MPMPAVTDDLDAELTARLRARGRRVTSQRVVINRLVRAQDRHVTAEEVHAAAVDILPGTSLPTVYATLELLEDLGVVRRVHAGRDAVRFDPRVDEHQHVLCRSCGAVEDLESSDALERALGAARTAAGRQDFDAERAELVVSGLCAECRSSATVPTAAKPAADR
jgi:Fe2+ or Zn2+ uptake regulation protein